jgi:hypothetical protein
LMIVVVACQAPAADTIIPEFHNAKDATVISKGKPP